ncbi:MAG TPA: double-cubane-cluster-containing anaerobic reductase [Bacteroidales bacterium]|nr:double-cubane-cluster-containing anaerobic reductase [Bacteroidales bacterium]HPS16497.1 double-cubane-cluster-containing anaerobic reductase [Bacteroidales bacterium]
MADYHEMWASLGLDLKTHDMVLEIVGKAYQDIFLSQKHRPKGMSYFDFVMSEIHGLRIKEIMDAKAQGRKVVGTFCVFVPEELVLAVDAVCIGLCAGAELGFEEAEKFLPRNTCSLIKAAFGFKLAKVCPYIETTDLIVGENTCDGKKKAYESYKDIVGNLYVMDLPQMKSLEGRALLKAEYKKFAQKLEQMSGKKITIESLKKGIEIANNKRRAIHRLASLRSVNPAPISGLDALLANQVFFYDDPERFTASVNTICDELDARIREGVGIAAKGTPRILLSGCPMAVPNWKLPYIIETSNAVIVGEEMCTGERGTQNLVNIKGNTVDELLDNIVERYFQIDCAVFTPNSGRLEHVKEMVKKYKAEGVIHYGLQFCQPYQMESKTLEKELEKAGIPVLLIETDYSQEDAGQLKTRIEAFIERIKK